MMAREEWEVSDGRTAGLVGLSSGFCILPAGAECKVLLFAQDETMAS
jgi:hypothetical protein